MLRRYIKVQSFLLLGGIAGPIFLIIYFASGSQPTMKWMLWAGWLIIVLDVLIALGITGMGARSAAKTHALEQNGVLALAKVIRIHETTTTVNGYPLVKLDLQISGQGITPFATQDRVIAKITRLPMITNRNLVALVDPATNDYQIDWERSALVAGEMPANFAIAEDNRTYDLSGQTGPLMEILQILRAHGIGLNSMMDLRTNPAAREEVQAVVRRAATAQPTPVTPTSAAASPAAAPPAYLAAPEPPAAQRLQELETLRATGSISEAEYNAKRQQIISDL
jgi:hypothetical protein